MKVLLLLLGSGRVTRPLLLNSDTTALLLRSGDGVPRYCGATLLLLDGDSSSSSGDGADSCSSFPSLVEQNNAPLPLWWWRSGVLVLGNHCINLNILIPIIVYNICQKLKIENIELINFYNDGRLGSFCGRLGFAWGRMLHM